MSNPSIRDRFPSIRIRDSYATLLMAGNAGAALAP